MFNEHHARIISLFYTGFTIMRKHRNWVIPPRPDDGKICIDHGFIERYSFCDVFDGSEMLEFGEKQKVPWFDTAHKIADDIVRGEDLLKYGLFVAKDEVEPTQEELVKSLIKLQKFYRFHIQDGDTKYSRPQERFNISDTHRHAVIQMGEKREWVYQVEKGLVDQATVCSACGTPFKIPDPAKCPQCGAILNIAKAAKFGLLPEGFVVPESAKPEPAIARTGSGKFAKKE